MSKWFTITAGKVVLFALLCVAVSSAFVIYMQIRLTNILAAPDWCIQAINAEKLSEPRTTSAFEECVTLMDKQIGSLAINSHIFAAVIAVCLAVLVVIVIAGGNLSFKGPGGIEGSITPADAAQRVAGAAEHEAREITHDVAG